MTLTIDQADTAADPRAPELLDWCLVEGTPITKNGDLIEVLPYEVQLPGISAPDNCW
jgi:hypothetical protein